MAASGADLRQLSDTPTGQASSQPAWYPDASAILFRRSGPGLIASIWRMGTLGENPILLHDPPGAQLYPSLSPDMTRILFTTTVSPTGDTDRAIQSLAADGTDVRTLFDVPGAYDSGPAWSPDGTRVAFESNADVAGANPEHDEELWVMDADGGHPTQLTHNAIHDEGAAWSADGTMLVYSSGTDNDHVDIHIMTTSGLPLRRLTDFQGRDESPDWQAIPAPDTDRRCGNPAATGPGVHDLRATGLSCRKARQLAARWERTGHPERVKRFHAEVDDFGGTLRVVLARHGRRHDDDIGEQGRRGKLVAFLYQPATD